jgi:predicted metal-binding membrane protein
VEGPQAGLAAWRRHPYVWVALLLAAALGWAVTIQQAIGMAGLSGAGSGMAAMSPSPAPALVFLPVWVAMMAAMMFPAIAPVVSLVSTAGQKRRAAGGRAVPNVVFVAGYLAIWTLFGVAAYLLSLAVPAVGMAGPGLKSDSAVLAGLILIFAGLYEWGPLKGACLRHCRSPLGTFLQLWRDGWAGAFRMGVVHGTYCLGCCWGLMLVLFAEGLMNLTAMVLLAAVIFAQKVLPRGELIAKGTGVALVAAGLAFALTPWL